MSQARHAQITQNQLDSKQEVARTMFHKNVMF